ncbi:MAG: hypothetical protein ACJ71F_18640, partial [Nitrososphaeraceae archaeon]
SFHVRPEYTGGCPAFLFKTNTKSIGIGLIILSVIMLYAIGNFGLLRLRHPEMALFVAGAITALRYKD